MPKGQRLSLDEWKKQYATDGNATIDLKEVRPIEELISMPGVRQRNIAQAQKNKQAAPVAILFAMIAASAGIYIGMKTLHLETAGLRAEGRVVDMKAEYSSGGHGGYTYHAVVDYKTADNIESIQGQRRHQPAQPSGGRYGDSPLHGG